MQTLSKLRLRTIVEGDVFDKYDAKLHLTTLPSLGCKEPCEKLRVTGASLLSA